MKLTFVETKSEEIEVEVDITLPFFAKSKDKWTMIKRIDDNYIKFMHIHYDFEFYYYSLETYQWNVKEKIHNFEERFKQCDKSEWEKAYKLLVQYVNTAKI